MSLEAWPEQLNYLAQRGTFAHKPGDPNVRSDYDSGPSRVRQRFTSAPNIYQFQVLMDSLEKLIIDGFFINVFHAGSDWFTMPVVVANEYLIATVRIVKDGFNWSDAGYDKWTLSLNIEIRDLPTLTAVEAYIVGTYGNPTPFNDPLQQVVNIIYPHATNGVYNFADVGTDLDYKSFDTAINTKYVSSVVGGNSAR